MREGHGRWRWLMVPLAAMLLLGSLAWPAVAQTAQTGTAAEAWYQGSLLDAEAPFCILPCPEVASPTNPYPEDTLHVGVSGGREEARTYFTLDLSVLPTGAPLEGGTVRMVAAGPDAGTAGDELADMVACLVRGQIEPVEGGQPGEAPQADCTTSSPLQPVDDDEVTAFTFDLAAFADVYPGVGDLSLAVLPSEEAAEQAQTWRVAFHGSERDTDDAEPISAEVRYESADAGPAAPPPSDAGFSEPAPSDDFAADPGPPPAQRFDSGASGFSDPPPVSAEVGLDDDVAEPEVVEEEAEPVAEDTPMVPSSAEGPYAYPQVWLLPLAFLCVGVLLVRALSKDYEIELPDEVTAA